MTAALLVLVWWNARGLMNKEAEFKDFLTVRGAVYGGVQESGAYKSDKVLSDKEWQWNAGPEGRPTEEGGGPSRGVGAFVATGKAEASVIRSGTYSVWHRMEVVGEGAKPLAIGTGHWPTAHDIKGHEKANRELAADITCLREQGYSLVYGGDLNAHTGSNFDTMPVDEAGRMMLETADWGGLLVVNRIPGKCVGGPSRVQEKEKGQESSTLDYVLCSTDLAPYIQRMEIVDKRMGSDHKPTVLALQGLSLKLPAVSGPREVWRLDGVDKPGWTDGCDSKFSEWLGRTGDFVRAANATKLGTDHTGNILEWSFNRALDEIASTHLQTKWVGPSAVPVLDAASRMAIAHRDVCEDVMKWVMADLGAPESARREARTQFLSANRQVLAAAARKRELAELRLFRDVESKQSDSKLFWSRFKAVRNSVAVSKSPPPVAVDSDGNTVTDPIQVLAAWREFSARIASSDLEGTPEEGKYDEDYKKEVEERLAWLKKVRYHQKELDGPISRKEVWRAIRALKMGKAPGEDGILTDILKSGAGAVGNSKLEHSTSVVDALVLMFNFVFENEVWPERWGSGVIFPIHKQDSRLDPGNYRPITLLSIVGKLFGRIMTTRLSDFSEATGSVCDEQGGFRSKRGTPDQIFIFREILASRKERGLTTYATYVDARKAYDTVWREQAYVRIHDSGVKGKLWRQLQAMHKGLSRRVQHPLGLTDSFPVDRGVAQGAVESPWVYSTFIDALATRLKEAGHGVMVAGVRVALLMYADDIVLLADTQDTLMEMNRIVTDFARRNRFQFNGKKSAVMAFNASPLARARCAARDWELSGETVNFEPKYVYLGALTTDGSGGTGWKEHVTIAISKARRRSADLLWMCRADKGIRPRTAITLWQSMVRPLLEYASELWSDQITVTQAQEAEKVQMKFVRGTLGLHANGSGVPDEVVRAETGVERIKDRWTKLRLGYWRRVFDAPRRRLLRVVAEYRRSERVLAKGRGRLGQLGWMPSAERTLRRHGMAAEWLNPDLAPVEAWKKSGDWKTRVYTAVERVSEEERQQRMQRMSSAARYVPMKEWGVNPVEYSFSSGEKGRNGSLVPERYLDDRSDLKGTRLKALCRLGCLPLMERVGREARPPWPRSMRICQACDTGAVEDVHHFMMVCPMHTHRRAKLLKTVDAALARADGPGDKVNFLVMNSMSQHRVLLGQRVGDPAAEDRIDEMVKRYLRKTWNARAGVTTVINEVMGTVYGVSVARKG